mmetsp:Transcript_18619/g.31849  ORF Transcript_18619/g.31849 Transcript_18619/m.31849 type:complete len:271 (-) Transcript_18619:87-899(-)
MRLLPSKLVGFCRNTFSHAILISIWLKLLSSCLALGWLETLSEGWPYFEMTNWSMSCCWGLLITNWTMSECTPLRLTWRARRSVDIIFFMVGSQPRSRWSKVSMMSSLKLCRLRCWRKRAGVKSLQTRWMSRKNSVSTLIWIFWISEVFSVGTGISRIFSKTGWKTMSMASSESCRRLPTKLLSRTKICSIFSTWPSLTLWMRRSCMRTTLMMSSVTWPSRIWIWRSMYLVICSCSEFMFWMPLIWVSCITSFSTISNFAFTSTRCALEW